MTSSNYLAWDIKTDDFPSDASQIEKIKFLIGYGVLAPSIHNTQPWTFKATKHSISIFPNFDKALRYADPDNRFLLASVGACAETIKIAAEYFGYSVKSKINSDCLVTLTFQKGQKKKEQIHPDVITERFSNKSLFFDKKSQEQELDRISASASTKNVKLIFTQEESIKTQLKDLHLTAVKKTMRDKHFVRELAEKLLPNQSGSPVGMPGFVVGMSNIQSRVAPKVISAFPKAMAMAVTGKDKPLVDSVSGFGAVFVNETKNSSLITTGYVYQSAALMLREIGVHDSILTAIVMQDPERKKVEKLLNIKGRLTLFFRFGYPKTDMVVHTPRRKYGY